jgi:hypothetical protein
VHPGLVAAGNGRDTELHTFSSESLRDSVEITSRFKSFGDIKLPDPKPSSAIKHPNTRLLV